MADYKIRLIVEGVDRASGPLGSAMSSLQRIGEFAAGGLLARGIESAIGGASKLMGSFAGVVAEGGNFEAQLDSITSKLGGTAGDAELLRSLIYDLGVDPNLKVSASEAADSIEMLVQNGVSLDAVLGGAARSTVLLANATGADFAQAADIATDAMAVFGLGAEDMAGAVNAIAGVTVNSKFDINDYAMALAQGGAAGSLAGLGLEEFNTAVVAMSSYFNSGSDAGTSFKTMIQRLVPQTDAAQAAMDALGMSFVNADGSMKSMAEIAGELNRGMMGLSESQKIQTLTTIFGADAMRAAAALAGYTQEEFEALQQTLESSNAELAAAARMDNLTGDMEIFSGIIETVRLQIGERFQPAARAFAQSLSQIAEAAAPGLVEVAGSLADWVAPYADALGDIVAQAIDAFQQANDVGGALQGAVAGLGAATGATVTVDAKAQIVSVDWDNFLGADVSYVYDAAAGVTTVDWVTMLGGTGQFVYDAEAGIQRVLWQTENFMGLYDAIAGITRVEWQEFLGTSGEFFYDAEARITNVEWSKFLGMGGAYYYDAEASIKRVDWVSNLGDMHVYQSMANVIDVAFNEDQFTATYFATANVLDVDFKMPGPEQITKMMAGLAVPLKVPLTIFKVVWGIDPVGAVQEKLSNIGVSIAQIFWGEPEPHIYPAESEVGYVNWGEPEPHTYPSLSTIIDVDWGNWSHVYEATAKVNAVMGDGWDAIRRYLGDRMSGGGGASEPGRAIGERNFGGGLVKVHRDEVLALPRGSHIFTSSEARAMAGAGAGAGVTINMGGVTVANDMDVNILASRIADVIRMRG